MDCELWEVADLGPPHQSLEALHLGTAEIDSFFDLEKSSMSIFDSRSNIVTPCNDQQLHALTAMKQLTNSAAASTDEQPLEPPEPSDFPQNTDSMITDDHVENPAPFKRPKNRSKKRSNAITNTESVEGAETGTATWVSDSCGAAFSTAHALPLNSRHDSLIVLNGGQATKNSRTSQSIHQKNSQIAITSTTPGKPLTEQTTEISKNDMNNNQHDSSHSKLVILSLEAGRSPPHAPSSEGKASLINEIRSADFEVQNRSYRRIPGGALETPRTISSSPNGNKDNLLQRHFSGDRNPDLPGSTLKQGMVVVGSNKSLKTKRCKSPIKLESFMEDDLSESESEQSEDSSVTIDLPPAKKQKTGSKKSNVRSSPRVPKQTNKGHRVQKSKKASKSRVIRSSTPFYSGSLTTAEIDSQVTRKPTRNANQEQSQSNIPPAPSTSSPSSLTVSSTKPGEPEESDFQQPQRQKLNQSSKPQPSRRSTRAYSTNTNITNNNINKNTKTNKNNTTKPTNPQILKQKPTTPNKPPARPPRPKGANPIRNRDMRNLSISSADVALVVQQEQDRPSRCKTRAQKAEEDKKAEEARKAQKKVQVARKRKRGRKWI